jgi:hypothetical protein
MNNLTIVTAFWNIRSDRSEDTYLNNLKNLLSIDHNMVIFIPNKYREFVEKFRHPFLDKTEIVITELDEIKNKYFSDYWDLLQSIRTNPNWYNSTHWLKFNPQYFSEWYNPIVMSKVFFLEYSYRNNKFNSNKFIWIDAGITQHISSNLVCDLTLTNMSSIINSVLFTSIHYISTAINPEIHGFDYRGYKKYTDVIPNWLCRATIFGVSSDYIDTFTNDYKFYLKDTLTEGYLGTEESIFTLLSCLSPNTYQRIHMDNTSMPDLHLKHIMNL